MFAVAYCTADAVRERLEISSNVRDSNINQLILAVSQRIDKETRLEAGAHWVTADSVRYYGPDQLVDGVLRLDYPLISVTTLIDASGATIPADKYRLFPRNEARKWSISLIGGQSWGWATDGEIAITGRWGWSLLPSYGVREAATMFAARLLKRYEGALQDATGTADLGTKIYREAIPVEISYLLADSTNKRGLV